MRNRMIVMLISDCPDAERKSILACARDKAALLTDEMWEWIECGNSDELRKIADSNPRVDIYCIDLTIPGSLELTKELRRNNPTSYIILIADTGISPVVYMRPQINAGSLMLKPVSVAEASEVFAEAISTYVANEGSSAARTFVVENRGERSIVGYQRINYFESREKKVFLCTDSEEFGFYNSLDELEKTLGEEFIRIHRSFLVNRRKITSVFISQSRVILTDGSELPLSRSYKSTVREYLKEAVQ